VAVREVPEQRRDAQHALARHELAIGRLGTLEARLPGARRRTAIPVDQIAVVAVLSDDQAVSTLGTARQTRANGFLGARGRAAVERQHVAVIATLRTLADLVSAERVAANAGLPFTLLSALDAAAPGAPIPVVPIAVVALLGGRQHAVGAASDRLAGLPGRDAAEARLGAQAVGGAAIPRGSIAVVTRFIVGPGSVGAARRCRRVRVEATRVSTAIQTRKGDLIHPARGAPARGKAVGAVASGAAAQRGGERREGETGKAGQQRPAGMSTLVHEMVPWLDHSRRRLP